MKAKDLMNITCKKKTDILTQEQKHDNLLQEIKKRLDILNTVRN